MTNVSIVRAGQGFRPFDINFFEHCEKIDVTLIHSAPRLQTNLKSVMLSTKSAFLFDPVSLIGKNHALLSLTSWQYLENLAPFLNQTDVICTLEPYFFISDQCSKICEKLKKPLIITSAQNLHNHPSRFIPPYSWNAVNVVRRANLFIAMTHRSKFYLRSIGIPEAKIKVIHPGVQLDKFTPPRQRQNSVPRILFVGNLIPSKGLPELLHVSASLNSDGFRHELWICGKGNLQPLVKKYASKYPIKYLGVVSYSKMPEVYRQCDIFCLPSRDYSIMGLKIGEEQFGFVFLEAMASALPIVTTNTGSIKEVVGSNNYAVSASKKELYFALKKLITCKELRQSIGNNNRVRVEFFFDLRKQCGCFESEIAVLLENLGT
jgi:glycosyltransferase involved in cell wall biosynthesis